MTKVSFSSISDFRVCPRFWYYRWELGRRPAGSGQAPSDFGTAFHAAQATLRTEDLAAAVVTWNKESVRLSWEQRVVGHTLLIAYQAKYQGDPEYRVVCTPLVEAVVEVPLLDPNGEPSGITLKGVIDAVAYDTSGCTVPIECKTTAADIQSEAYWRRAEHGGQASTYMVLCAAAHRPAAYLLWDVIKVPRLNRQLATPLDKRDYYVRDCKWGKAGQLKPGQRENDETHEEFQQRVLDTILGDPEQYFARMRITKTEVEQYEHRADLWGYAKLMEFAMANPDLPVIPRNPDSCNRFGRPCEYDPVCWKGASIFNENLYQVRRRRELPVAG
jgi:CRISPR/Cas system-associated exonuclease Cas4 (RecB family)